MINQATLIGNVGADPDIQEMPDGTLVANFALATNEFRPDKDGNRREYVEWHRVAAFGKSAEFVKRNIAKGSLVHVSGKIQNKKYIDKNGIERFTTKIRAGIIRNLRSPDYYDDE